MGLLLGRYRHGWRRTVSTDGFAAQLGAVAPPRPAEDRIRMVAASRAATYGGVEILAQEDARAVDHTRRIAGSGRASSTARCW